MPRYLSRDLKEAKSSRGNPSGIIVTAAQSPTGSNGVYASVLAARAIMFATNPRPALRLPGRSPEAWYR